METFNVFDADEWEDENDRAGYRHRVTAFGRRLGASLLGGSLYELPPGEKTWPYHYEQGCEEWLMVVAGKPTLRSPDGEQQLEPGDFAVFPEGPAGAHQVINGTDEPAPARSASGPRARATGRCCATSRTSTTGKARPKRARPDGRTRRASTCPRDCPSGEAEAGRSEGLSLGHG
ncbi:MAG: cupin domain-containing protein [Actinobacteria bacterium]|nr:MAG: cupin domain-containing protein [Actinomycetota bacterium]